MGFLGKFVARAVLAGLIIFFAAKYIPGVIFRGDWQTLLIAALVVALIHSILRPILRFLSFPIIWLTLGLFGILIDLGLVLFADQILSSLTLESWLAALWLALLLALSHIFV